MGRQSFHEEKRRKNVDDKNKYNSKINGVDSSNSPDFAKKRFCLT